MTRVALLGAKDWRHPEWSGQFYPEDMPEDWRLAFYATQFSCVWLSHEAWRDAQATDVADWIGEVPPGFLFLLDCPDLDTDRLDTLIDAAQGHAIAMTNSDRRIIWFNAGTDLSILAEQLKARTPPVYLISQDADLEKIEQVSTLLDLLGM
jgi:uncharacterized protein YecE (DUF72 family)